MKSVHSMGQTAHTLRADRDQPERPTPFHEGERVAQMRAGVGDMTAQVGGFIRDHLPEQHRAFHSRLPFLVASGADAAGHVWVTLLDGAEGFVSSPDPQHLGLETRLAKDDPLADTFQVGADIGFLGIDLATRRRNRFNGRVQQSGTGYSVDIRQTFGNCPQYINPRAVTRGDDTPGKPRRSDALTPAQMARIAAADTLFIGSGHPKAAGRAGGYDASHRGGAAGFVRVETPRRLLIPDYAGNNFFNTIGNLIADPRVGLLFVDFATGGLLHLSGRARIDWAPNIAADPDALRWIDVEIEAVVDRPAAISLRWTAADDSARQLRIAQKQRESDDITSFYLVAADGRPLDPFKAGQHLSVGVQIPGQQGVAKRAYSLSGPPDRRGYYRISVKREDKGRVSRHLHDRSAEGSLVWVTGPAGDFVAPEGDAPLVLVSAGVGVTPMLSILWANAGRSLRDIWFVHGTKNGATHAFKTEQNRLLANAPRRHRQVFYSQPQSTDHLGDDYDAAGRITAADLLALGAGPTAQYMLCGPAVFQSDLQRGLEAGGVRPDQNFQESFGPESQKVFPPDG